METLNKILITGASGFIGSHLTKKLVQEGFEVGIIKRENSDLWRIKGLLDKIATFDVDLKNARRVHKILSGFRPDVIFHLATFYVTEHKAEEVPLMVDANVLGTLNLLEASKDTGVRLVVNTSSCFVYKQVENKLKENAVLEPLNVYALTKIHGEHACAYYTEKYGLKTITFRLFPPYGPADHERRLIPYAIKSFLSGIGPKMTTGKQRWDFIYVGDIVDAYLRLLSVHELPERHEVFNIGTGNAVGVREVVNRIKEIIGSDAEPAWGAIPHRNSEVWFTCADTSKSKNFLRWKPKTSALDEGLELTVEWYKNFWKKEKRD